MVVLHKVQVQAGGLVEGFLVEAFIEEATGVAEHLGFDDEYFGYGCGGDFHLSFVAHFAVFPCSASHSCSFSSSALSSSSDGSTSLYLLAKSCSSRAGRNNAPQRYLCLRKG